MKHRIYHSNDLRARLPEYASRLGVSTEELSDAYDWMLMHDAAFEESNKEERIQTFIAYINIESRISHPVARRLYAALRDEIPALLMPVYGINWPTFKDRCRRLWEQCYNIVINKIPSHHIRIWWLRIGGAKIGKGSSVWRNTEVIGIENLRIGADSVVGWHCQIDARAGLVIGDHVTVASYVLMITAGHDTRAPEFWAIYTPIHIEEYAWIASRAMLISGARVGRGAVVGGGSIVNKHVAPYKIVVGLKAKPVGERPRELSYRVGGKGLFTLLH